jgi:hypothetical protein
VPCGVTEIPLNVGERAGLFDDRQSLRKQNLERFEMSNATKSISTTKIAMRFKSTLGYCAKLALAGSLALAALGFGASTASAGPNIFIADSNGNFGILNLKNGVYSPIGTTLVGEITAGPHGAVVGFDGTGGFYSVAADGTDTLITQTGLHTDEPAFITNTGLHTDERDSKADGTLYLDDLATHDLYRINPKTGAIRLVGFTGFVNLYPPDYLVLTLIAGQTDRLYGITTGFDSTTGKVYESSRLYKIDRETGTASFIVDVNDDNVDCALIADGTAYLFDNTAEVSTLNLATGAVTPLYDLHASASLGGIVGIALIPDHGRRPEDSR